MKPIKGITKRNLIRVIRVSLSSYEFNRKLIGKWMRKPSGMKKRKLNRRSAAAKKNKINRKRLTRFRWFVDQMKG